MPFFNRILTKNKRGSGLVESCIGEVVTFEIERSIIYKWRKTPVSIQPAILTDSHDHDVPHPLIPHS